jgi:hypothetical protein
VNHLRAVAVVLSVAGLMTGCTRQPAPTVFLDPALAVLLPPDTTFLAGVRMQKLRADATVDKRIARAPRLLQFRRETGLPPDSDVWEYLIANNGTGWLTFMRGKFTDMGMEPHLDKPGASRLSHNGVTILGDQLGAVAFLNPTTAIAGRIDDVIRTLDLRNNNVGVPAKIEELTNRIPAKYEIWFASTGLLPGAIEASGVRSAFGGVNLASGRYDLSIDADRGGRNLVDAPVPSAISEWILGNAPTARE